MDIYELDHSEAIILQSSRVQRNGYDESEFEDEELHEIVLTNKNIIYVVAPDGDWEDEFELETIKVPLSALKIISGHVQAKQMKHEMYGNCLQIQFKHGIEYWQFGGRGKKDISEWIEKLNAAVLYERDEQPVPTAKASNSVSMQSGSYSKTGKSRFCTTCGATLSSNAKFCSECGASVNPATNVAKEAPIGGAPTTASTTKNDDTANQPASRSNYTYDGKLHKCRNCGEVLKSFELVCPACGHELRDTDASSSIRAFAEKMEQLQQNGKRADKDNIISHIRTFPVPNTKEDLFEFIILVGANIRENRYDDDLPKYKQEISDAWKAKFEQAYRKAKIAFKGDKSFREIEDLYRKKMGEQKQAKRKSRVLAALPIIGLILINVIGWGGIFLSDHIKIKNETERLESIVEEVYTYIEQEQYILARSKVSTLVFSGSTTQAGDQASAKWDITRQQLLDIIDKAEYGADYVPGPREIRIGVSQDDLKDEDYSEVKAQLDNRGFTNIKTEAVKDLLTGWWTSEGTVDKVSVGGDTVFSEDSVYSSDVEIIIYYHAKQ